MWIITCYAGADITMFEFETEKEARKALENIKGTKILTEVIYSSKTYYKKNAA